MSDSSAGRGLNTSYEQAVPLPDYSNQVSDQAYDLPPPPDELRFNMDSISQSNSSITNVSTIFSFSCKNTYLILGRRSASTACEHLVGNSRSRLNFSWKPFFYHLTFSDLPPPSFEDEIMQAVSQPPLEPGWKRKTPNDPDWAPAQYQQKGTVFHQKLKKTIFKF